MSNPETNRAVPDYTIKCCVCEQTPTVSIVDIDNNIVAETELCGPCCWGEAAMADPTEWNK